MIEVELNKLNIHPLKPAHETMAFWYGICTGIEISVTL